MTALRDEIDALTRRMERCNSWLWDNWRQAGTPLYAVVEDEFDRLFVRRTAPEDRLAAALRDAAVAALPAVADHPF